MKIASFIAFYIFANTAFGFALGEKPHSLLSLGEDFFVRCSVKPVKGAKLLLFNADVATALQIKLPSDEKSLEEAILSSYAVQIDECEPREGLEKKKIELTSEFMFATRYNDSEYLGEDYPHGDGRAVWTGEIESLNNGPLDVVLKGVGRTTLAKQLRGSENSDVIAHNDGLQSLDEGILSYTVSEINRRNHIDGPRDLAVILLPETIQKAEGEKHGGKKVRATITIRVGQQTRIGHFSYYDNYQQPINLEKMVNYAAKRALNKKSPGKASKEELEAYFRLFAQNTGRQAAQLYDLMAHHGSITRGNMNTLGYLLDLGTFSYLRGYPQIDPNLPAHLVKKFGFERQREQIFLYLDNLRHYLKSTSLLSGYGDEGAKLFAELKKEQERSYRDSISRLTLSRIGLDAETVDYWMKNSEMTGEVESLVGILRKIIEHQDSENSEFFGIEARYIFKNLGDFISDIGDYETLKQMYDEGFELGQSAANQKEKAPSLFLKLAIELAWGQMGKPMPFSENLFKFLSKIRMLAEKQAKLTQGTVGDILQNWARRASVVSRGYRPADATRDYIKSQTATDNIETAELREKIDSIIAEFVDSDLYDLSVAKY